MVSARASKPDAAGGINRAWYPYCKSEEGHAGGEPRSVVIDELLEAIRAPWSGGDKPTQSEIHMRHSEFKALIAEASAGRLRAGRWDEVHCEPSLWELRWSWTRPDEHERDVLVRGYFHEPAAHPGRTILAKVHVKKLKPRWRINWMQTAQMRDAAKRITTGELHQWGFPHERAL